MLQKQTAGLKARPFVFFSAYQTLRRAALTTLHATFGAAGIAELDRAAGFALFLARTLTTTVVVALCARLMRAVGCMLRLALATLAVIITAFAAIVIAGRTAFMTIAAILAAELLLWTEIRG